MASVPVTISGVLYDKINRTSQAVVLIGEASLTGLGVGGGPIYPPEGSGPVDPDYGVPGGRPPHVEHPIPPRPEHPIVLPPDPSWPPIDAHPEHPIVIPPPNIPTEPPAGGAGKPPPADGGWGWSPEYGWGYFPGGGGKPVPPGGPG